jgi:peptidoglycan/xylan/chitin deacetylase (PgdA/CDA1 family)
MPAESDAVYLTFDDGPLPEVTEFVLETLAAYGAKGTFFCIGKNVAANPELYRRISDEGHATGNHTHNHLNGWMTPFAEYITDIRQAEAHINSPLFRPPYGRIRKAQADVVCAQYRVVMWDVLSYDFSSDVSPERCLKNVIENTRPGSIVVFHDSVKAFRNLQYALPRCLEYFKDRMMKVDAVISDKLAPGGERGDQ